MTEEANQLGPKLLRIAARPARRVLGFVLIVVALTLWLWGIMAVRNSNLPTEGMRAGLAWCYGVLSIVAFLFMRNLWKAAGVFFVFGVAVLIWWSLISPSNDRAWTTDMKIMPVATIDGDLVTIKNIRNFHWTSVSSFEPGYYDKTFDLSKLDQVDLILSYWDELRAIAHTILSFGFEDGTHLAVSIEIRREEGESYSTLKGIFKQYELFYVVADERDLIRVRTNQRGEVVHVYPTRATREDARKLFLAYMDRVNELEENPEFYHTLFNNCTTSIVDQVNKVMPSPVPYGDQILLNGYSDKLAYDLGWIDTELPYADMRKYFNVTGRAKLADDDPAFSERIREYGSSPQ